MTEVATVDHSAGLSLAADEHYWNPSQLAVLRHMGVEGAGEGDLTVFHHVCKRTGLDPFARQIYMIGRDSRVPDPAGGDDWVKVRKFTIQTGIDGFRLIGRRAADRSGHKVSVGAPEWAHEDGGWRPVWRNAWGAPVAARVIIHRDGEPFEAVALFDEYKQTKHNGQLTSMWAQRPAGQIAKCAEALAWRMAFPQDLSGIYTDDEMGQAENVVRGEVVTAAQQPASGLGAALSQGEADTAPVTGPQRAQRAAGDKLEAQRRQRVADRDIKAPEEAAHTGELGAVMVDLFTRVGLLEQADRLAYARSVIGVDVDGPAALTSAQAEAIIARLEADLRDAP